MRLVPPGGFAGFSQMTPASQSALTATGSSSMGKTRRRKAKKAAAPKRRRKAKKAAKTYTKRRGKLAKGSPAAKARMAKLRKMRKKK